MDVLAWVTGLAVGGMFLMSGAMKITGQQMALEMAEKLGYSNIRLPLGVAEVAGAVGVIIGLLSKNGDWEWAGFLAAIGLFVTMIGAVVYHVRAGDEPKEMAPAIVSGALIVLYLVAITQR